MAAAYCSVFSLVLAPFDSRRSPTLILVSSRPSKFTLRKNRLRPKILKTLPKPILPQQPSPPPHPPSPILCPLEFEIPAYATHSQDIAAEEADTFEDLQVSEATAQYNGISGNVSATTFFKYGGIYLVGAFVFQSLCSFWFLSNYNSNHQDVDLEVDATENNNFLFNGNGKTMPSNVIYLEDQLGMKKKIEEIKLMAREARRVEELKKEEEETGDSEIDGESPLSRHRFGIEKEIGARLLKMQDRINSNKDSSASAALQMNSLGSSVKSAGGVARDDNKNVNQDQGNEALIFKKKLKFRSPSTKPKKTPKGFTGTRNHGAGRGTAQVNGSDATDHAQMLYEDKQVNQQQDAEAQESVSSVALEGRKLVDDKSNAFLNHGKLETPDMKTEAGFKTKNTNNGGVQETSFGKSALEVIQSGELRTQNSQGSVEENQDTGPIFEKDDLHSINGSSRHGLAKKNSGDNRVKVKQANTRTDMWWLNLRYVLVILMQRGSNGGGQKGLYSLKFTSNEQDQGDDSYTVAFEDDADANNFCFLLESFFKDLGDFSADAVPMSIQELYEEITSHAKKVVVVKKRQLQLYAGQPLTDVEMALSSLIEQDQNVP